MPQDAPVGKRQELIEIASRLFYAQGYGATGIKQVIDEAGIAKGTFYTHFKSKEELGLAWLQARHATWNRWLAESVESLGEASAQIAGSFDFLEKWLKESEYRGCAFINTMAETPDSQNPMRAEVESHKLQLLRWFQRQAVAHFGALPKEEAKEKGTLLYVLFEGALVESQLFSDSWPVEAARKAVQNLLAQTP